MRGYSYTVKGAYSKYSPKLLIVFYISLSILFGFYFLL